MNLSLAKVLYYKYLGTVKICIYIYIRTLIITNSAKKNIIHILEKQYKIMNLCVEIFIYFIIRYTP